MRCSFKKRGVEYLSNYVFLIVDTLSYLNRLKRNASVFAVNYFIRPEDTVIRCGCEHNVIAKGILYLLLRVWSRSHCFHTVQVCRWSKVWSSHFLNPKSKLKIFESRTVKWLNGSPRVEFFLLPLVYHTSEKLSTPNFQHAKNDVQ